MAENKKKVELEITGVMSGDYEAACMDVTEKEYERLTGEKPEDFDESMFYKNLFRYYGIEVPKKYIQEFGEDAILKMKITYEIEKVGDAEKK